MDDDRLHHLTKDAGGWVMRVTVDRGPKLTGKPLRIKFGKCSEAQAIKLRDQHLRAFGKAGVRLRLRKQKRPAK